MVDGGLSWIVYRGVVRDERSQKTDQSLGMSSQVTITHTPLPPTAKEDGVGGAALLRAPALEGDHRPEGWLLQGCAKARREPEKKPTILSPSPDL